MASRKNVKAPAPKAARKATAGEIASYPTVADAIEALQPALPVYALYPKRIAAAVKTFMSGFPGTTLYAVKANPAPAMLDLIYKAGLRHFDTASLQEVKLIAESQPGRRLDARSMAWDVTAPAEGEKELTFTVEVGW